MGEISNVIDNLDLVPVEVGLVNIKLQLLIEMRFDIIGVNSDHLRHSLFQNIVFLFSQRLVVDKRLAFSTFLRWFWMHTTSFCYL